MRTGLALGGALAARAARTALDARPPGGARAWERRNYRGAPVSLLEGPAFVVGAVLAGSCGGLVVGGARLGAAVAVSAAGAGALGCYDDRADARVHSGAVKGLRGHAGALRRGQSATGLVKVVGLAAVGLAAGALVEPSRTGTLLVGGLVAGSANLANLLDLRPGRAAKVALLCGVPLGLDRDLGAVVAGPLGALGVLLPAELAQRCMLGDLGANALGAVLGLAVALRLTSVASRAGALGGIVALTLASEVVSFSALIERTPVLRWFDGLGQAG